MLQDLCPGNTIGKHPGQLIRVRDLTFKVHPLQLFVHRKQGQICSFEIKGTRGRINGCLILAALIY